MPRTLLALAAALASACGDAGAPPAPTPAPVGVAPAPTPDAPPLGPHVFPVARAAALDDPSRDGWQQPERIIEALAIPPDARIADVGCGTGYFTVRLLAACPASTVLAVDIQQGMLDLLAQRLSALDRPRVVLRRTASDRPLEPTDALDLVLCANTLHEVARADRGPFVRCMAAALRPGGRLACVDWLPRPTPAGPPLEVRVTADEVRRLALDAGLVTDREREDLLPMHAVRVYARPTR